MLQKQKLWWLGCFILLGNSFYLAQNSEPTTHPKRTYATKNTELNSSPSNTGKTTRTYTPKPSVQSTTEQSSEKPNRTYATKPNRTIEAQETVKKTLPVNPNSEHKTNNIPKEPEKKSEESFWSWLFGRSSKKNSKSGSGKDRMTNESYHGHKVYIGPKGGKYYINKNGNKTYIK
ncbi:MAG: hypothetical protein JSS94_03615 [Bacteroidetes bacterium]|nr:hypothetical protein [Bacteroidota bacterium]